MPRIKLSLLPKSDVKVFLLLAGLTLLLLLPAATLQGVYFYGDALDYFTRLAYSADHLRAGQVVLWNPYLSFGGTHAGDPASMAWYFPALFLFLLLPLSVAINYTVILHVLLAAAGMYVLSRRWKQSNAAALLSGVLYSASGFTISHLQHLNILVGLAWLPVVFLVIERVLDSRRIADVVLASLVLALQILGGHTQIVLYGALAWGAYAVVRVVRFWRAGQLQLGLKGLFAVGCASAAAIGLSAIFLLPLIELLNFTTRVRVTYEYATSFSLEPLRLISFIQPYFFGGNPGTVEHGSGSLIEMTSYVGIFPLVLAPFAILRQDWRVAFLVGLGITAFLLALGKFTPLYYLIYPLPLLGTVRAPARFLFLVVFALAGLAGFGLDALRASTSRRPYLVALGALLLVAVGSVGVIVAPLAGIALPTSLARGADNIALKIGLCFIAGSILLWIVWLRRLFSEHARTILTIALVFADLWFFAANFRYNFLAPASVYNQPDPNAQVLLSEPDEQFDYYARGEIKQFSLLQQDNLAAYLDISRATLRESLPMRFGVRSTRGYGSESPSVEILLAAMESKEPPDLQSIRLARRLGIRFLLSGKSLNITGLALRSTSDGINLYEIASARRAQFWHTVEAVPNDSAALADLRENVGKTDVLLLEGPGSEIPNCNGCEDQVTFVVDDPQRVSLQVQANAPGYLLLNDTFYPGWRATVDQQAVTIYRANGLFRAVSVPAGTHRVEFTYDPLSVRIGALLSGGTLLLLLMALAVGRYQDARQLRRIKSSTENFALPYHESN